MASKTGDTVGGLLNATLGNLTELVIALAALRSGQYMLVKASIACAIVTNTLFMLGASFLLGGLKHHVQEFNRISARLLTAGGLGVVRGRAGVDGLGELAMTLYLLPPAAQRPYGLAGGGGLTVTLPCSFVSVSAGMASLILASSMLV